MLDVPPTLRALLAVFVAWFVPYAVRRWLPSVWIRFESWGPSEGRAAQVFQSLPSVAFSALSGVLTSGEGDVWAVLWPALSTPLAPLVHHLLKASPLPYQGRVGG